jgi:hypothetical protein
VREYIAARRQAPLLLLGSWILIGKSDDGKKIEMPRRGVYPNQLREGAMSAGGAGGTPIRIGYLTPAAARLAPHGDFAQVRALRRIGCESQRTNTSNLRSSIEH